jgi:hypothetical protein
MCIKDTTLLVYNIFTIVKSYVLHAILYVTNLKKSIIKFFFYSECTCICLAGCERLCYTVLYGVMFTVLQIILGTIGCEVLKKTLCPVLVVFLYLGQEPSII